jgi:DNA-3-methyladenine glycosylase I
VSVGATVKKRCDWAEDHPLMIAYHDQEWGRPVHDEHALFEAIILDGAQAGLSWLTVLKKRDAYRQAYDGFDPAVVARYTQSKTAKLLANPGIIRNKLKVASSITNAQAFLKVQDQFDSFDQYIWQFVGGKPRINSPKCMADIPVNTPESDAMSKDLKQRGFKFVGTTICYAFMQAKGLVNDHLVDCFCRDGQ